MSKWHTCRAAQKTFCRLGSTFNDTSDPGGSRAEASALMIQGAPLTLLRSPFVGGRPFPYLRHPVRVSPVGHLPLGCPMQIRPCRIDDLPRIQALDALSFGTHHIFPDFVLRQYLDLAGPCFLLAEGDGQLLGYVLGAPSAAGDEPTGWMLSAATAPHVRGQGVAKMLGREVLNEFRRRGIGRVLATVSPDNLPSQRAQQALGFRLVSREADYLGPVEDRLVMEWRDDRLQ